MKKFYVLVFFIGLIACSKSLENDFNKANELLKQNKIEEAVAELVKIAESGDKNFSPKALAQLATIYQNKMDKSISDSESADKAQFYFRTLYDKYPEHPDAPKALFMSAFILANELNKYDEATKSYKLFLEKFPEHELAASAKQELEYIGLSPEEILKKKMAQQ
ncbi:tetratricopeptide repeat protein [Ignavibacterium sp.]|jgi:TolA-binding protein|uniref:tetratricopeptide repeat protein n=1 Tax=Ignavibacterium sp. TaxID=2651167 RepID=UPI0025BA769F|nr:tetratricopeptide repeat protein [Ignavibacterium sp.]